MSANAMEAGAELPKLKRKYKLLNFTQGQLYGLFFGHIGKLSMIALYFILTQWLQGQHIVTTIFGQHLDSQLWNVKYTWDHLLSSDVYHGGLVQWLSTRRWNDIRHVVRPFMEGLMALLLYQQIGFDSLKYEEKTKESEPGPLDRFLLHLPLIPSRYKPVTTAQEVAIPFIVLLLGTLIAIPMFLWVLPFFHDTLHAGWLEPQLRSHPSLATKLYADSFDAFIIGIVAGFAVKRITRPVLNANMLFFCRRWVAKGRKPHWWMPQGMRSTIQTLDMREDSVEYNKQELALKGRWFGPFAVGSAIVLLILAIYGYYIIAYIA
ncbi:MAG: hypothetical protein H0U76_02165 [Ktedonobacteraceae bacterium]|nr:hypothetical protein [Ktedonobacteraceae bacterium]